ncbi:MAG: hypothetical protein OEO83_19320 [Alphaproteobacteria bacterium]|nr:hypothetical protein [Alphaproteobacteria bacterium]
MRPALLISSLVLLLLGGLVGLLAKFGGDVVTSKYASYEAAMEDNLFDRGWLPELIPSSATSIVTNNNLDLNISHVEFRYDPADTDSFLGNLRPYRDRNSPTVEYKARVEGMKSENYRPYEYRDYASFWVFFVNSEEGHVVYDLWTVGTPPPEGAGTTRRDP